MGRQSSKSWFMDYKDAKSSTRLLISLPVHMLVDLHAAAKLQDISVAEFARRAMTRQLREVSLGNPELALSGKRKRV